jgi:hypothetical protein
VRQWFLLSPQGTAMTQHPTLRVALLCMSLLAASATQAQNMSKPDYKAGKTRISETYKTDKAECKKLSDNAQDICKEEAKGKEKLARAELEFGYSSKAADANKVLVAKAKAAYEVAHEKCDNLAGDTKASCVAAAKAKFGKN